MVTEVELLLRALPSEIDGGAILRELEAASTGYNVDDWQLPLPVWRHRAFEQDGPGAWAVLQRDLQQSAASHPFSVYLHVPFCSSKCHFCDCYSFRLGNFQNDHITGYVDRLLYEIEVWSRAGTLAERPVSTVHLGGGTPTFLGEAALARIVDGCRRMLRITDATEWALESSVQSLTDGMIGTMDELGFRRLHLGVQTLQSPTREMIGRRRPASEVLERISDTLSLGWVVTADLLCGLPQQTPAGVVYDVQTLLDAGIDGLSLYELEVHGYNRRWAAGQGLLDRTHVANYVAYQAAIRVMEAAGLRKNLFNHWAGPRDRNIYFTYPTRGEDCLAIGTIADGAFGDYHYRHPRYAPYLQAAWDGEPGLEGGLRRTPRETELLPVSTGILSGHLEPVLLSQIQAVQAVDGASLLDRWLACGLLTESHDGSCALTGSGSWFAGSMVQEWVTAPIYA